MSSMEVVVIAQFSREIFLSSKQQEVVISDGSISSHESNSLYWRLVDSCKDVNKDFTPTSVMVDERNTSLRTSCVNDATMESLIVP
mmetsp:Transcript_87957/g.172052  ORF Transcript_87957/g.172052 Transcript_87957/m.172052 type:complete len:86 (-) Transcript_87957:87-344(-)